MTAVSWRQRPSSTRRCSEHVTHVIALLFTAAPFYRQETEAWGVKMTSKIIGLVHSSGVGNRGSRRPGYLDLELLLSTSMTLGMELDFSVPQFPYL